MIPREMALSLPLFVLSLVLGALLIAVPDPLIQLVCGAIGLIELLAIHSSTCMLPGSICIAFMYVMYLVAPALVHLGGYDQDVSYHEISSLVTGSVAIFVVVSHVMWRIVSISRGPRTSEGIFAWAEKMNARWLWFVTGISVLNLIFLIAIGAGKHMGGGTTVDAPFHGTAENLRSLIYTVSFVLGIKLAARPGDRSSLILMLMLSVGMLVNSLYSGRKEDFSIHLLLFLLAYFARTPNRGAFTLRILLPVALCGTLFVGFMYRLRSHPVFHGLDKTSSPTEIFIDTVSGQYAGVNKSGNPFARFDLLEPTSRYFTSDKPPMYDIGGKLEFLKVQVLPRLVWPEKPLMPPDLGLQFALTYGYNSFYGQYSVAFGYLAEMHFWLGWPGLLVVMLLPLALDAVAAWSLARGNMSLPRLWLLICLGVFVERTIFPQLLHIGLIAMLLDLIWQFFMRLAPVAREETASFRKPAP